MVRLVKLDHAANEFFPFGVRGLGVVRPLRSTTVYMDASRSIRISSDFEPTQATTCRCHSVEENVKKAVHRFRQSTPRNALLSDSGSDLIDFVSQFKRIGRENRVCGKRLLWYSGQGHAEIRCASCEAYAYLFAER